MPLWIEPELCLEYKGVRVYREFPNRYVCAGREIAPQRLLGAADLLAVFKALIDCREIG